MTEPWFDANHWAWLPGTLLGCLAGLWGSVAGFLVPRRQGRTLVFGLGLLLVGLATVSVIGGLIALAAGQPFDVWFFLVFPFLPVEIPSLVFLCLLPRFYRQAEDRSLGAGRSSNHPT